MKKVLSTNCHGLKEKSDVSFITAVDERNRYETI